MGNVSFQPVERLRRETSTYLDLLRVVAVALVLIDHAKRPAFTGRFLFEFGVFGQEAVAIFFVLSGLLISHAAMRPQRFGDFIVARLSRLWSVVVPAVALTIGLDVLGRAIDPGLYAGAGLPQWEWSGASAWRALSPILFLNSVPGFGAEVGSNGPFWSLSYEAWYYLGFGVLVFGRGWLRVAALLAIAWFVGAPILQLAPIWGLGVLVRRVLGRGGASVAAWAAWLGTVAALSGLALLKYKAIAALAQLLPQEMATNLVERYAVAVLVAANIVAFDRIGARFAPVRAALARPLQLIVDRSFSLYLYQAPLLFCIAAALREVPSRPLRITVLYVGTIGIAAALASVTEQRRGTVAAWLRAATGFRTGRKRIASRS